MRYRDMISATNDETTTGCSAVEQVQSGYPPTD
jgi:hypothetical protein